MTYMFDNLFDKMLLLVELNVFQISKKTFDN
jgi:hypothetical protein